MPQVKSTLLAFFLTTAGLTACVSPPANLESTGEASAQSRLVEASASGDLKEVQALSNAGVALNVQQAEGSPLGVAAARGHLAVMAYLLNRGADASTAGLDGLTPLMRAAANGHAKAVRMLLKAGADVDTTDPEGRTALAHAALEGELSTVKTLLAAGADVNTTWNGQSLLMRVVASGDMLTSEALISAGADVNYRGSDGRSAMEIARAKGLKDLQMLLSQNGARADGR